MFGSTRILTASGNYTNVSDLAPGTMIAGVPVINRVPRKIFPIRVEEVRSRPPVVGESIVSIRHDAFHSITMCSSKDVRVLTRDETMKRTAWLNVAEMDDTPFAGHDIVLSNTFVMPPSFDEPPEVERRALLSSLTYELGLVFGVYLRVGSLRSYPETRFVFDAQSINCISELKRCAAEIFKASPIVTQRGHIVQLSFMSRYLYNMLTSFGTMDRREIPENFRKPMREFAAGINVGIVTSGHAGLPRLPRSVHETLYFGALASGKHLSYGQIEFEDGEKNDKVNIRACFGHVLACENSQIRDLTDVASRLYSLKFSHEGFSDDWDADENTTAIVANNLIVDVKCPLILMRYTPPSEL